LGTVARDSLDRFGGGSLGALKRLSRRSGFGFTFDLYQVNKSPIVEIVKKRILAVRGDLPQWREEVLKWFIDPLRVENSLLVYSSPETPVPLGADETASVRLLERSSGGDRFRVRIESSRPVPVLVKVSYFPKWHAYKNGKEIPILIASPYLMLVNDTGEIVFSYGDRPLDVFSKLLLVFPIIGLAVLVGGRFRIMAKIRTGA